MIPKYVSNLPRGIIMLAEIRGRGQQKKNKE